MNQESAQPTDYPSEEGEGLEVQERLILSPAVGVFRPCIGDTQSGLLSAGLLQAGQTIGVVETVGAERSVASPHAGWFVGLLAEAGERVRAGQPVAWLRVA